MNGVTYTMPRCMLGCHEMHVVRWMMNMGCMVCYAMIDVF